jgi:RNA polymerase sigma-70 factor (ECF subfamily)
MGRPGEPEEIALSNDEEARAVEALHSLQTADQEILMMSAWDDLSGPEIASILGVSRNTVHQRLHRAKKRLAKAMDEASASIDGKHTEEGRR